MKEACYEREKVQRSEPEAKRRRTEREAAQRQQKEVGATSNTFSNLASLDDMVNIITSSFYRVENSIMAIN